MWLRSQRLLGRAKDEAVLSHAISQLRVFTLTSCPDVV